MLRRLCQKPARQQGRRWVKRLIARSHKFSVSRCQALRIWPSLTVGLLTRSGHYGTNGNDAGVMLAKITPYMRRNFYCGFSHSATCLPARHQSHKLLKVVNS